jgi:RimJ/RimL family protein N-acetyltransferase
VRFPDDVPVLTDGVVTLRAHTLADVDAVFEQCSDPVSQRWTTVPVPYTRDHAQQFVSETVPAGWGENHWAFAVEAVDELADPGGQPRFCGTVELRDEGNRRAEIAFGAHPWARGRGIVEAALRLLLEWGFHEQRLRTVIWWANAGNWASRRVAWKVGFSFDGTLDRWLPQRGDLLDAWVGVLHVDDERAPRGEWLTVPRLLGDRVVLRGLRADDVDRIVEACTDERTTSWISAITQPFTAETARHWLSECSEGLASGRAVTWALADPGLDLLVGAVNVFGIKKGREAEIGYWTHPSARASGLMTEACRLVVRHCFTPYDEGGLGLVRLEAIVADGNTASQQVVEGNGFSRVGHERRALRTGDGNLVDALRYDLLADEVNPNAG